MLEIILQLIVTPLVLWVSPRIIGGVYIKDIKAAIWASVGIIVAGLLVGWLITLLLNMVTLGFFALIGLGVLVRIVANAIIIEIVDQLSPDFDTVGFLPSLWLAVIFSLAWGFIDLMF